MNVKKLLKEIMKMGRRKNRKQKKNKGYLSVNKTPAIETKELEDIVKSRPIKLRFSPTAWSKLLFMRDIGNTEVGGFAITRPDDLLYVKDFFLPKQTCSYATVVFDDVSIADYTDQMIDEGLMPEQFLRIWIHTHPNISASPSRTDEKTFSRVFGKCEWAVMMIIAQDGEIYCKLRVTGGPLPGDFDIPVGVDFDSYDFPASNLEGWLNEYNGKVEEKSFTHSIGPEWYRSKYNRIPGWDGLADDFDDFPGRPSVVDVYRKSRPTEVNIHRNNDSQDFIDNYADLFRQDDDDDDMSAFDIFDLDDDFEQSNMSISDDILEHISPNDMALLNSMSAHERQYFLDDLKNKKKIGD